MKIERLIMFEKEIDKSRLSYALKSPFQWRDWFNQFHFPTEMGTNHIVDTLKMMWNHAVPDKMKIYPYKKYSFSSFYTEEYILDAIYELVRELRTRKNLNSNHQAVLTHIGNHTKGVDGDKKLIIYENAKTTQKEVDYV